ncbi:hypothetical protein Trydic_g23085 [Trypoxylus dichotomus]
MEVVNNIRPENIAETGLNFGSGISFHVDEIQNQNLSLLERHSLHMDLAGIAISVSKVPGQNKVEIDIYSTTGEEGRGKKMGEMIVPIFIGFKVMAVGALMFAAVGSLVLQSLAAAKLSLLVSSILAISKLFGKQTQKHGYHHPHIRYQQLPPLHTTTYDFPIHSVPGIPDYSASIPAVGFDGYANYPSPVHEIADSRTQAEIVGASEVNESKQQVISLQEQPVAFHKRQYTKRILDDASYKNRVTEKYE